MPYLRFDKILAWLPVALALFAARGAAAQGTTTGGPVTASDFTFKFEAYNPDSKHWAQLNDTEATYFFNRARCECQADTTDYSGFVKIALQPATTTDTKVRAQLANNPVAGSGSARLYAGGTAINCLAAGTLGIEGKCLNLINPSNYNEEISGGVTALTSARVWESPPIPVAWFFGSATNPMCGPGGGASCDATDVCSTISAKQYVYLWVDTTGTGVPDATDIKTQVGLVGKVSLTPSEVTVEGGNRALTVRWQWPEGSSPSSEASVFKGIQIFCVRGADLQVFEDETFNQSYMTAVTTCKDAVGAGSGGLTGLDPRFLCSNLLPSTTNEYRIKNLQNGAPYGVAVAVIDRYLNVSALSNLVYASPVPTVDFYTEYKDLGGAAQGGYCQVAPTTRAPGLLALAGLVTLGLLWWRRRRRGGTGPWLLVLVASGLTAGTARAQAVYYDDMADSGEADRKPWNGTPRSYAIEARFGLYAPNVDSEFSGDGTKPHSFIFGSKRRPMWQLEFDWELLQVFGTFSVGGVVGYFKENAKACILDSVDNAQGTCERSGDNTSLRLIPLAALAIYRFDVLAERWKIPIVPYGKVGLNYTLWKVTEGNGFTPSAGGGRGAGGTLGWQAAVGISLQLDFLDPSSARGFDADLGVNHTYAFFEMTHIDSSGLGSKNKLHVGDDTWFAGLMFEF